MNTTEEFIFMQHMKNIDVTFEDFARECMAIQTPETLSIIYATDIHYIRKYALFTPAYYNFYRFI